MGNFNRFGGNNRGGRDSDRHNTFSPRDGGNRLMMHPAVCDDCGKNCEVPFKPTGNREIFCSDCFEKRGGKDSLPPRNDDRNFNRFDREDRAPREDRYDRNERPNSNYDRNERSGEREMFSAICDDCGKDCQLPFKPSSSKPVYCSRCFETRGEKSGLNVRSDRNDSRSSDGGKSKEIGELKAQMFNMNAKLEKIMKALNIATEKTVETTVEATKTETAVEPVKEVAAVKVNGAKSKVAKKAKKAEKKAAEVTPVVADAVVKAVAPKKAAAKKKVAAKKTK